jgi:hypothetical protein
MRTDNPLDSPGCREKWWYFAFFGLALLIFWPARHAGFVGDWFGGQALYEQGTLWQAANSFGWRAILPVMFVTNFLLFKMLGTAWLPWFLIAVGLHATNAGLLYHLVRRWLARGAAGRNDSWVALGAAFLFLLSPYAAEPVVSRACIQYLLGMLLFFNALHDVLHYVTRPERRLAWRVLGLFVVAIFLTEWAVIMPAMLLWAVLGYTLTDGRWREWGPRMGWLVLPSWVLLGGWFLLNRHYLGHWAGHYGDETHLHLDPRQMWTTIWQYLTKYAFFTRYLRDAWQNKLYGPLDKSSVLGGITLVVALATTLWLLFFKKINPRLRWAGVSAGLCVGALLPVSNLFFSRLLYAENDRYGYFASGFFWLTVLLLLSGLPRWVFRTLVVVLVAVSILLLGRTVRIWADAERVFDSLVQDFRWHDRPEVVALASPDNLRGVLVARIIGEPSGWPDALALRRRQPFAGKMWDAVQFNMTQPTDGIRVEPLDSTGYAYKIAFAQDGNWFWREGIGAKSYRTEAYELRKNEWDCTITFPTDRPRPTLIYPVGGKWEEVK